MKYSKCKLLLAASICAALLAGCSNRADAPKILDMTFVPQSPVPTNTDVHVTAQVEGSNLSYNWKITGGILREVQMHSGQLTPEETVAVTESGQDNVGAIIGPLGYTFLTVSPNALHDIVTHPAIEAVFINSSDSLSVTADDIAIRDWVEGGGALYASGRAAEYVRTLWPNRITFPKPDPYAGSANPADDLIQACIVDDPAQQSLGFDSLDLTYPSYSWPPVIATGGATTPIITADASSVVNIDLIENLPPGEDFEHMPVAMYFAHGDGIVVFTSFHYQPGLSSAETALLDYLAALVVMHPLKLRSHDMADMAGYFPYMDFVGLTTTDRQADFSFEIAGADDVFLILNARMGALDFSVTGPGDLHQDVSGPAPITMAFPNVADGEWSVSVKAISMSVAEVLPFVLSVAARSKDLQLVTSVPEVIWRTPMDAGTYTITLRAIDDRYRVDEMIVGIKVE